MNKIVSLLHLFGARRIWSWTKSQLAWLSAGLTLIGCWAMPGQSTSRSWGPTTWVTLKTTTVSSSRLWRKLSSWRYFSGLHCAGCFSSSFGTLMNAASTFSG
eukprot:1227987-Pyramimonas_sp.AAC.1